MIIDRVKVKVPKALHDLDKIRRHIYVCEGRKVFVEDHYEIFSNPYGPGVVQRNFFRFTNSDFDKYRVATVKTSYKINFKGKLILLLDIYKAEEGAQAVYELRFQKNHGEFEIPGIASGWVAFDALDWPRSE